MKIHYDVLIITMLFVILASVQYTLNKIFKELKEIKSLIYKQKLRDERND